MQRPFDTVVRPACALLVVLYAFGCGAEKSSNLADSRDDDSSIFLDKNSAAEIPEIPRRRLVQEFEWHKKRTVTFGLETSFGGSTFSVQTDVEFTQSYAVMVWLFAPGDSEALINEGTVFMNNSPDRRFNYVCRYMGYFEASPKVRGKISLFGTGVSEERTMRERSAVVQTSGLFPVEQGSNWKSIYEHCLTYGAEKKYRESIDRDLIAMTKGLIYHDDQSECMQATHCSDWFDSLLPGVTAHTVPACDQRQDGVRFCSLRGKEGNACSLYDKDGTRLTRGLFEYPCQAGTTCKATKAGGWFRNWSIYSTWEAQCQRN